MLEEAEAEARRQEKRHEAEMRGRIDPLRHKSDRKFIKLYRLSKSAFVDLCDLLETHTDLKYTQRVSLQEKVGVLSTFTHKSLYLWVGS